MDVKIKNIILFAAIIVLCQCKDESKAPYPNESVVTDNAEAAVYFHAIFCETEYVWAFIDSMDYTESIYKDPPNVSTGYRELKCTKEETTNTVIVEYHRWERGNLSLAGNIRIIFSNDSSYRKYGMVANVYLDDFSINGQDIVGEASIKYTGNNEKDLFTFTLLNGSNIYELGKSKPVLISGTISNGQYERVEGSDTFFQNDDLWAYYGVMSGLLRNDPSLKYTNTVSATFTEEGENKDGRVYFNTNCTTAEKGRSLIKIPGRSDIIFYYGCSECYLVTVTHVD